MNRGKNANDNGSSTVSCRVCHAFYRKTTWGYRSEKGKYNILFSDCNIYYN